MSNPDDFNRDIREYLEKEPNLRREDRITHLRAIFDKHFTLNKLEHVVNYYDIYCIIGTAKSEIVKLPLPLYISKKHVIGHDIANIAIMEAFVGYLNRMHLLNKFIKFDYTE